MPLRSDWSTGLCPVRRALDVLGDPWVLLIIRDVLHGHGRFEELHENLGISEAVLSRRLRAMVEADLLVRVPYLSDGRTRQGYAATSAAAELLPVLQQLALWGERHTPLPPGGGHMSLIHRECGNETTQGEICSSCGRQLLSEQMTWVKPWRGSQDDLVPAGVLLGSGSLASQVATSDPAGQAIEGLVEVASRTRGADAHEPRSVGGGVQTGTQRGEVDARGEGDTDLVQRPQAPVEGVIGQV